MLTGKEVKTIHDELMNCQRPMYLFHDDPDGLASFLLLYRLKKEGKGITIKAKPKITSQFIKNVKGYDADKVFILDIAEVEQEFADDLKVPIIWIDHHPIQEIEGVKYFNPQKRGVNVPVSSLCWQVVQKERPEDLWIAGTGVVSDWHMPTFGNVLKQAGLINNLDVKSALFDSKLGVLVKVFSFNLKGSTSEVNKSLKIFTRIKSPYEILNQETAQGKFVWKKYEKIKKVYDELLKKALKAKNKSEIHLFIYQDDKLSLTKDIANELLYRLNKIIVIGREKNDEIRCSIRAPEKINVQKALEKALVGIEGYGGGHEHACGAAIKKHDFKQFIENLKKELKKGK